MNINHVEPTKYIPSLTEHSVAYREYLVYHGYAKSTVQHCEEVVARFSRWMLEMCHPLCDINETLIE
ncbi:hypothetical protein [Yersinia pseudotuberculosis]|uniref:hypothetical protein n=1 Tax=Yersinia pseudotuberculosis TaxID=633 RepID=UPI0005E04DA7|nr:hypothetical protein [Yersinia pseudotuberculosis]CNC91096.1 Uncharacterised protein [Yersinia pseudotuberculosis]